MWGPPRLFWSAVALAALATLTTAHPALGFTKCTDLKCVSCDSKKNRCTLCVEGMFLASNGVCTKCKATGCRTCSASGTKCTKCMQENMYIHTSGSCRECNIDFCATCNSTGQCTKCWDSLSLSMYLAPNGTCQSCGDYCAECRPDGSCAKCWPNDSWTEDYTEPTFLIVRAPNGTCAKCTKHPWRTGCRACSADGSKCTKCGEGSVMINSTCHPCKDKNCAVCSPSPEKCQKCMKRPAWAEYTDGYGVAPVYMDREGNCRECTHLVGYGCKACDQDGKCKHCDPDTGRVLRNGVCVLCDGLVEHCNECTAKGKCTACEDGFHLRGGKCVPCDRIDPLCEYWESTPVCSKRCATCTSWGPNNTATYLDGNGRCRQCMPNCLKCSRDGRCRTCDSGFRLVGSMCVECRDYSDCVRCGDRSEGCSQCTPDGKRCLACWDQYKGVQKQCFKCLVPFCDACLTPTKCDACASYTYFGNGEVDTGVYKDAKTGQCRQCQRGCSECNARRCLWASEGYVLVGGQPKRCADPLCVECDAATQKKCLRCNSKESGSYMFPGDIYVGPAPPYIDARGKCHKCTVKGCELCGIDGRCRRCKYGYTKVKPEGKCVVV